MALGTAVDAIVMPPRSGGYTFPISIASQWQDVVDDASATDNAGSSITQISQIGDSTTHQLNLRIGDNNVVATSVLVRLAYDNGQTPSTDPVIQVFGLDLSGATAGWMAIYDADDLHEVTLTTATATDLNDGSNFKVTKHKKFDCLGCVAILVGVKTGFADDGSNTSKIQAMCIN